MKNNTLSAGKGKSLTLLKAFLVFFIITSGTLSTIAGDAGAVPVSGRWDLTVTMNGKALPSWLEVKVSGVSTLVGYFVADVGSARPVAKMEFVNNRLSFAIPAQWEGGDKDMLFEAVYADDKLTGTITSTKGEKYPFTGVRAPLLKRDKAPVWGSEIVLFNGKNLDGWQHQGAETQWVVENGILRNPKAGSNLLSKQKFSDFKLHAEFRYPAGSNGGMYLRGRYELQIIDSKGQDPSNILFGAIYGFLCPNDDAALAAGEWQSYDVTLTGRRITVVANGKTVICDQIIPGITGGAIDSNEGEPGPLMLQGDHGVIEFRKISITPAR